MPKMIRKHQAQRIQRRLTRLYGNRAPRLMERFYMMIGRYGVGLNVRPVAQRWDENDVVLITYADMVREPDRRPLASLKDFCTKRLKGAIRTVHILPFTTWSSDDGFSVIDYRTVDPRYGKWVDVEALGHEFSLMFDLVCNHCSAKSSWFEDFVTGIAPAEDYFITKDPDTDLSQVTRPRPWPLLTRTMTRDGERWVWTTFSADQVDLDWSNPDVLFEFLDILFLYIAKGARIIRLDAVAFLWKKVGTSCIHLPQTHQIVKLIRDVLEVVAPEVVVLTETNVPHKENVSYFGRGDEAHMVYNFSLPPLVLHALLTGNGSVLTDWAKNLGDPPEGCTFFNFTASHDGIGVRPLQGIVEDKEIDWLVEQTRSKGGRVGMRKMPDGSERPYELNITYYSALAEAEDEELGIQRFLLSQAIMLAFKGVPAVYFHSLTGTENWIEGAEAPGGENRTVNRYKWDREDLTQRIENTDSATSKVFQRYLQMIRRRANHPAFHPDARMKVYDLGPDFLSFTRTSTNGHEKIICLFNLTEKEQKVKMNKVHNGLTGTGGTARDILSATSLKTGPRRTLTFKPYEAMWLVLRD